MVTVLNVVLFNESSEYEKEMKQILERFHRDTTHRHNVIQYFIAYSDTLEGLVGNVLYIRGKESIVPGILEKTIFAIEHFKSIPFDYLIRSNMSTIIDFNHIPYDELKQEAIVYASSLVYRLTWLDPGSGIHTREFFGTLFASGTNIIFNKKGLDYLLEHKDLLRRDIVDDVSIAILMNRVIKPIQLSTPLIMNDSKSLGVMYRNRLFNTIDRKIDIERMKEIVAMLLNLSIDSSTVV
jgi:hypothetical protein